MPPLPLLNAQENCTNIRLSCAQLWILSVLRYLWFRATTILKSGPPLRISATYSPRFRPFSSLAQYNFKWSFGDFGASVGQNFGSDSGHLLRSRFVHLGLSTSSSTASGGVNRSLWPCPAAVAAQLGQPRTGGCGCCARWGATAKGWLDWGPPSDMENWNDMESFDGYMLDVKWCV